MEFLTVADRGTKPVTLPDSKAVAEYMADVASLDREALWCLHLDSRLNCIDREMVSLGAVDGSMAHPREVFKKAIVKGSSAIILVHNHPSGATTPSDEDLKITKRLAECGYLLGISVVDHIIITPKGGFYSFADNKCI